LDFKQIEAFLCVAKLKSFSKAANTIFLSQPTISSHISSLEKELNIQLFDRTSKEVNLTPAGGSFMQYANDIINTRNHAVIALSDFNNNISGVLNLSASTTPCNTIVPGLLKQFASLYPDVTFNILEQSSGKIIKDILDLNTEIGIVGTYINNDKIKNFNIMKDELVIISSPQLNLPEILTVKEFSKYKFISREKNSATRNTFETELSNLNLSHNKLNILCEVNNIDTLIQLVQTGIGISIVSKNILKNYRNDSIKISTLKNITLNRDIYLAVNCKRTLSPTARAFFNMCVEKYKLS
jgi:DNA-binding transcriptional LysR family regulator